jgi:hypothetical protein
MVLNFNPTFDEPEEGPAEDTEENESHDMPDSNQNIDSSMMVINFDPNFDVVDTRDEVLEEEQYNTWAQHYEALDPGFRNNDAGTNTNKNNILIPC